MNEQIPHDQPDIPCQPIDLHVTKTETEVDEEKKKKFSIDSILGREVSPDDVIRRVDFFQDRSLLQHDLASPNSSLIQGN